mgnify:CR=1 FL=1
MRVSYKRAAVKDMEATRDYIAGRLKNPKAAKKLMTELLKAISLLADNPYMGAALAEKFEITTDVRYFVVSKQLIFLPCERGEQRNRNSPSAGWQDGLLVSTVRIII